jgi:hypothetical protein
MHRNWTYRLILTSGLVASLAHAQQSCVNDIRIQVHKSIFTGSVILGGKWLELTEHDTQPATGYLSKYVIGYDSQQKHLVEFDANNFGAATYASDTGWQNQVLTMTSPLSTNPKASYVLNRFQYTIQAKIGRSAGPPLPTGYRQIISSANGLPESGGLIHGRRPFL